jgi:two-component system sensor histidine kinase KdpD
MLIRRARRVSDYLEAECFAVWVSPEIKADQIPDADREAIAWHLNFARNMRIQTRILKGNDVAQTLVDFAKQNQVTQIFLTRTRELRSIFPWNEPLPQKIVRLARDIQIVIVSSREPRPD